MKSHSTSLTMPSSLAFLFNFSLADFLKVTASRCSENASHTSQTTELSKVTYGEASAWCNVSCGRNRWTHERATHVSAWTYTNLISPYSSRLCHWTLTNADNPLYALSPLIWFLTGGGAKLFRKPIKPLPVNCFLEAVSTILHCPDVLMCPVTQSLHGRVITPTHTC